MEKQYSKEQFIEYAKVKGAITDEQLAIDLLCKTPYAWYALDESLKGKSSIIMYYQPMGHANFKYLYQFIGEESSRAIEEIGVDASTEIHEYEERVTIPQKGFNFRKGVQVPDIKLPEGFNFELYRNIQNDLAASYYESFDKELIGEYATDRVDLSKYSSPLGFECIQYPRKNLAQIVDQRSKEAKTKQFV